MTTVRPFVERNLGLLREAVSVIRDLEDRVYAATPPPSRAGGVGMQFRHIMDLYTCFLAGVEEGRVDYDRRERDPAVERSRESAIRRLDELIAGVDGLAVEPEATLLVRMDDVEDDPPSWSPSTVSRELRFLQSHTIHHFAVIGWMLRGQGIATPEGFGVAPSTVAYWEARKAARP